MRKGLTEADVIFARLHAVLAFRFVEDVLGKLATIGRAEGREACRVRHVI